MKFRGFDTVDGSELQNSRMYPPQDDAKTLNFNGISTTNLNWWSLGFLVAHPNRMAVSTPETPLGCSVQNPMASHDNDMGTRHTWESLKLPTKNGTATRWAPASYKWSYNPYKWPYN